MSKPSRRPNREEIKRKRRHRRKQQRDLRARQAAAGLIPNRSPATPNATSSLSSVSEEEDVRLDAVAGQIRILKQQLPKLLKDLGKIPNPRDPHKTKHKLTVLLLYGLLMFVFQFASRRAVNKEMTEPQFKENLRLLFPELEDLPHADTLFRLLRDIDVEKIEQAHIELVRRLIRGKKFRRYLINNCYPIAIDGSQKAAGDTLWEPELLQRTTGKDENAHTQYYVYVLEANLAFHNGMIIPLLSEFLEYEKGDSERNKQDCETRAFHRLAKRIKSFFPRLPILLLLDGLYAKGPIMERCERYNWQFMIVLKDKDLKTVWRDVDGLRPLQSNNSHKRTWGDRHQQFWWVNDIEYHYQGKTIRIHVVVCEEEWNEVDSDSETVTKTSRHVWISSRPLNRNNVHERCNLGARYRWGIEVSFLVEKHQGYQYEHLFALNWNAMRGYHYLMRMAHVFNTLARFSTHLAALYREKGIRGAIHFIRQTCAAPWLNDRQRVLELLNRPFRLQFE